MALHAKFQPSVPGERRGGRQKGTPNRIDADIKNMVLRALSEAGGWRYLEQQAHANPVAFMGLVGKVLPLTISAGEGASVSYVIRAPSPIESADEWLKLHAPSDQREPVTINGEKVSDETGS